MPTGVTNCKLHLWSTPPPKAEHDNIEQGGGCKARTCQVSHFIFHPPSPQRNQPWGSNLQYIFGNPPPQQKYNLHLGSPPQN